MAEDEKIVLFGKGGIGKSTITSNLAVAYAQQGKKVLVVGCDPKHDTVVTLTKGHQIPTVLESPSFAGGKVDASSIVFKGVMGIDCVEAGGPEPGIGCAGRGISRMADMLRDAGILVEGKYDVTLFDVLGDVVCGGFAAPLRQGFAKKVVVITSEELMSLYAANNIARAVRNYASNGITLLGLVANMRDPEGDEGAVHRLAGLIGTQVLGFIKREPAVREAEYVKKTVMEHAPDSNFAKGLRILAQSLHDTRTETARVPTPLTDPEFHEISRLAFHGTREDIAQAVAEYTSLSGSGPQTDEKAELAEKPEFSDPAAGSAISGNGDKKQKETWTNPFSQAAVQAHGQTPERASEGHRRKNTIKADDGFNAKQWGASDQWRRFFCDTELQRNAGQGISVEAPYLHVQHSDIECHYATPDFKDGQMSYFNFPWATSSPKKESGMHGPSSGEGRGVLSGSNGHGTGDPSDGSGQGDSFEDGNWATVLGDLDVIQGGQHKLETALKRAAEKAKGSAGIVLYTTCVPTVIGDDAVDLARKYTEIAGVPVHYSNPAANEGIDMTVVVFKDARAKPEFLTIPRRAGSINLIGFPEGPETEEWVDLLRRVGIEVNARILPRIKIEDVRRFMAAEAHVFYPNKAYAHYYEKLFDGLTIRRLNPPAPYGLKLSQQWLFEVAGALGLKERAEKVWSEELEKVKDQWQAGISEAAGSRLAFVGEMSRLKGLSDGSHAWGWGIPMVPVLKEMGFSLDYLVYSEVEKHQKPSAREDNKHTLQWFQTPTELAQLLENGKFHAVYSEYFFDRRITSGGKNQFSLNYFKVGHTGAVKTLGRLLELCRWNFYRRYADFIKK
ncbi:MAG: hypothetical protein A3G41_05720 [Elusimicrobia bacterium RIFCSPLOWO2_12_FULL_59_9]|nr:MAG: hypothetical protein A3G41_05720 [Elusimicrobia bacterium RIFCSPLOWO2_12_FULL_59_9]